MNNVSCECDLCVIETETQFCKLRHTSDTIFWRASSVRILMYFEILDYSTFWLSLARTMLEFNAPARGGRGLNIRLPPACIRLPCTLNEVAKGGKGVAVPLSLIHI